MITWKELKERFHAPSNDFWKRVGQTAAGIAGALTTLLTSLVLIETSTGNRFTIPAVYLQWMTHGIILAAGIATGIATAAKFTKVDLPTAEKINTPEGKLEVIKEIANAEPTEPPTPNA